MNINPSGHKATDDDVKGDLNNKETAVSGTPGLRTYTEDFKQQSHGGEDGAKMTDVKDIPPDHEAVPVADDARAVSATTNEGTPSTEDERAPERAEFETPTTSVSPTPVTPVMGDQIPPPVAESTPTHRQPPSVEAFKGPPNIASVEETDNKVPEVETVKEDTQPSAEPLAVESEPVNPPAEVNPLNSPVQNVGVPDPNPNNKPPDYSKPNPDVSTETSPVEPTKEQKTDGKRTLALRTYREDLKQLAEEESSTSLAKKELEEIERAERETKEAQKEAYALKIQKQDLQKKMKPVPTAPPIQQHTPPVKSPSFKTNHLKNTFSSTQKFEPAKKSSSSIFSKFSSLKLRSKKPPVQLEQKEEAEPELEKILSEVNVSDTKTKETANVPEKHAEEAFIQEEVTVKKEVEPEAQKNDIFSIRREQKLHREKMHEIDLKQKIAEEKGLSGMRTKNLYEKKPSQLGKKLVGVVVITVPLLLLLIGVSFFAGLIVKKEPDLVVPVEIAPRGTIFSEFQTFHFKQLPLEKMYDSLRIDQKPETLNEVVVTLQDSPNRKVEASVLLDYTDMHPPRQVRDALSGYYLLGAYKNRGGELGFVFIGATNSYAAVSEGLSAWEPLLVRDVNKLFGTNIVSGSSVFVSDVVDNIPVRRLKSPGGGGEVIYSVTKTGALILTTTESAFLEAIRRVRLSIERDVV